MVHDLFEEQTSLENVILKTLQRAQRLLKCERAAVMLLEDGSEVRGNAGEGGTSLGVTDGGEEGGCCGRWKRGKKWS